MSILVPRDEMTELFFQLTIGGVVLEDDKKSLVTAIDFDDSDSEANLLRVTIADKDRYFLDQPELLAEGQSIKLEMGYAKHHPELFNGKITHAEASFDEDGVPYLVLGAIDNTVSMASTPKTREFKNVLSSNVIKQIAAEYGYQVIMTPTEDIIESVKQDAESDAQLISRLADNEAYIWYVVEAEKKLYWGKRLQDDSVPVCTLGYDEGNYGIISFSPQRVEKNKTINVSSTTVDTVTGSEKSESKSKEDTSSTQIPKSHRELVINGVTGEKSYRDTYINSKGVSKSGIKAMKPLIE